MNSSTPTPSPKTPVKKSGLFRWGAIVPFVIICLLVALYFTLFFDMNLRHALEWGGYKALGSEVDIGSLETSFIHASIQIHDIEFTDAEKPTQDSIKIGDIKFGMLWDALLRVKFVINEVAVEQIEFGVPRSHPGRVAPPEPPKKGPGAVEKLKNEALRETAAEYKGNVFGDIASVLGGQSSQVQLEKLQETLPSKVMIEKFQKDLQQKQNAWNDKIKTLPQGPAIKALGDRLNKIKSKDFKSPQEVAQSLTELQALFKDADAQYKQVQSVSNDLNKDLQSVDSQYKQLQAQIQTDVKTLEQHFRIPQIDAKSMSEALFAHYMGPYLEKVNRYKALLDKYLPPKLLKKDPADASEMAVQPHPREKGVTYEFPNSRSYPLVWIKKVEISSQAGATAYAGNVKGEILDITSNQTLVGRPTVATLQAEFPAMDVHGVLIKASLDNTGEVSQVAYQMSVSSYPLEGRSLVQTPEVNIAFNKAKGSLNLSGTLVGLKDFTMNLENHFTQVDYRITAQNQIVGSVLKSVFAGIPVVTLTADGHGQFPDVAFDINSNLGPELGKGFEKQLQAKVGEARKKIEDYVQQQIGPDKAKLDTQINQAKGQITQGVKKSQDQLAGEKNQVQSRIDQATRGGINTKQIEQQGKKALDDLKKQFGL